MRPFLLWENNHSKHSHRYHSILRSDRTEEFGVCTDFSLCLVRKMAIRRQLKPRALSKQKSKQIFTDQTDKQIYSTWAQQSVTDRSTHFAHCTELPHLLDCWFVRRASLSVVLSPLSSTLPPSKPRSPLSFASAPSSSLGFASAGLFCEAGVWPKNKPNIFARGASEYAGCYERQPVPD